MSGNDERARAIIGKLGGVVVALSGGVDSAVVLCLAREVLGERVAAATAVGEIYARTDRRRARALTARLGVLHLEFPGGQLADPLFLANPRDRCYRCKSLLFQALRGIARTKGFPGIIDGTNASDAREYRPGLRAAAEFGVVSPLLQAGLEKKEVRSLAFRLGLEFGNEPPESCLATRIPYGDPLTPRKLEQIRAGEGFLRALGYSTVRLRHHGELARIEVDPSELIRLVTPPHRNLVLGHLRTLGFNFVTSDIAGYRTGSFDGES